MVLIFMPIHFIQGSAAQSQVAFLLRNSSCYSVSNLPVVLRLRILLWVLLD